MSFYFHMQAFKNESMYSSTSLNTVCRKNNCYIPPSSQNWWVLKYVIFQVLTTASMKFRVFWDVVLCSHVEVDRRFRGAYCIHYHSSTWWWRQYALLKRRSTSTWLHGATSQKTLNFGLKIFVAEDCCYTVSKFQWCYMYTVGWLDKRIKSFVSHLVHHDGLCRIRLNWLFLFTLT
jgi:hypothetical protein